MVICHVKKILYLFSTYIHGSSVVVTTGFDLMEPVDLFLSDENANHYYCWQTCEVAKQNRLYPGRKSQVKDSYSCEQAHIHMYT